MTIHDRGSTKWKTSFMLPEHVKLLNDYYKEQTYKDKPVLDEQQKMEINSMLQLAIKDDLTVRLKYFYKRDFRTVEGKILLIDVLGGRLRLDSAENSYNIVFNDILEVEIL